VGIGQLLQTIPELLLSGAGSVVLGIAATVAILSPLAQRYLATRKRVYFRVQSDSKIGLDVALHDGDHADDQLIAVAELVSRLSFVVIRIRNTGGEVSLRDLDEPVEFTFRDRVIWNARRQRGRPPRGPGRQPRVLLHRHPVAGAGRAAEGPPHHAAADAGDPPARPGQRPRRRPSRRSGTASASSAT